MSNIDKIKSRIEDRLAFAEKCAEAACEKNLHNALEANEMLIRQYKSLLAFIDSLPEEKSSEDLEKEIGKVFFSQNFEDDHGRFSVHLSIEQFSDIARHFYELGLKAK